MGLHSIHCREIFFRPLGLCPHSPLWSRSCSRLTPSAFLPFALTHRNYIPRRLFLFITSSPPSLSGLPWPLPSLCFRRCRPFGFATVSLLFPAIWLLLGHSATVPSLLCRWIFFHPLRYRHLLFALLLLTQFSATLRVVFWSPWCCFFFLLGSSTRPVLHSSTFGPTRCARFTPAFLHSPLLCVIFAGASGPLC